VWAAAALGVRAAAVRAAPVAVWVVVGA